MRGFARNNSHASASAVDSGSTLETAIVANLAAAVVVVGANDGEIIYTNPCWDRMFGYGPGELLGRHVAVVNAAADVTPEARAQAIFEALARDGVWNGEVLNVRKDGSRFWTASSISALDDAGNGPAWIALQTDITGRMMADESLAASEERYRRVFKSSPAALAMVD